MRFETFALATVSLVGCGDASDGFSSSSSGAAETSGPPSSTSTGAPGTESTAASTNAQTGSTRATLDTTDSETSQGDSDSDSTEGPTGGVLQHGMTWVLDHSPGGLGEKAAPTLRFDDASGTDILDTWDFAIPGPEHNGPYAVGYRTPQEVTRLKSNGSAPPLPHDRVQRYIAGAHFTEQESNFYSWNVMVGLDGEQATQRGYVSYYMRIDPDWTLDDIPGPEGDHNFKEAQMAAGGGPWGDSGDNWYYGLSGLADPQVQLAFNRETLAGPITAVDDQVVQWYQDTGAAFSKRSFTNPRSAWVKVEYLLEHDTSNGRHRVYADNVKQWDVQLDDDNGIGPKPRSRTVFGGYAREDGNTDPYRNNFRYYADVYYDTSWARVILANAESYPDATIVEPQPLISWTDDSISITVNLGRIPAGPAYLHVFDDDDQPLAVVPVDVAP